MMSTPKTQFDEVFKSIEEVRDLLSGIIADLREAFECLGILQPEPVNLSDAFETVRSSPHFPQSFPHSRKRSIMQCKKLCVTPKRVDRRRIRPYARSRC